MIALERSRTMPQPGSSGGELRYRRRRMRAARRPAGKVAQRTLTLHLPPVEGAGAKDLLWAGAALLAFGLLLYGAGRLPSRTVPEEETVEWIEEKLPPPVEEVKEPPKPPPPPPPDPDVAPPPPATETPPPVFGIPEDATSEAGDMAVATGNSLRMQADSVVQAPPPPLPVAPAAPIELDKTPAFVKQVGADYPEWAQDQGVEARVLVWVTIDTEGRVTEARLKKGAGRDFDPSALKAARASLFQPLVRDGRRLPSRFVVTYDFRLEG